MAEIIERTYKYKNAFKTEWLLKYSDELGNPKTKVFHKKGDADEIRHIIESGNFNNSFLCSTVTDAGELYIRVRDLRYRDQEISARCYKRDKFYLDKMLTPTLGKILLVGLTPIVIQRWVDDLRKAWSSDNIRKVIVFLNHSLTEAQRFGYITHNVIRDVPPRLPRKIATDPIPVPTKSEVKQILRASSGRLSVMIELAVLTGVRAGEMLALRWRDIDFENHRIQVRHNIEQDTRRVKQPKSRAGIRDIPIPPGLEGKLASWREPLTSDNDLLFHCADGSPLSWRAICRDEWRPLLSQQNLPPYRFHALRHFAASCLIEAGLPPKRIQYLIGHASIKMTFDRYGRLFPDNGESQTAVCTIEQSLFNGKRDAGQSGSQTAC